jgi:alpha-ketoglutarate-dependent 2,4-dichlorophenoxyacetate dioxygenase
VPQAVVRTNPANGCKNFFAGAHASHIRGLALEEGRILLKDLTAFAVQPQYVYTHTWRPKDLVIWDNRCCLHRGRPWDKARYRRVMHRTTVAGIGPTAED